MYNSGNADEYHHWVVMSIEKNRSGAHNVDLDLRKRFEHSRFDTDGGRVEEELVGRVSLVWPHCDGLIWPHLRHAGALL